MSEKVRMREGDAILVMVKEGKVRCLVSKLQLGNALIPEAPLRTGLRKASVTPRRGLSALSG